MFVNSIAIWYKSKHRPDKTQMAMLYPASMFVDRDAVIEWALKQRVDVTYLLAYDGQANIVVMWSA